MAKKIEDTIKFVKNADNLMSFGKSFATLNGQPLDKDSIFSTLADATAFAKTPSAYVGKILVVVEGTSVTAYVIDHDSTLKPVGDKATMDGIASDLKALSAKEAADVKKLEEKDTAIDSEIAALKAKDTAIDEKDAAQDASLEKHAGEITALQEKDKTIDQTISNLDAAYKAADTKINETITALDTAYKAADTEIKNKITTMDTAYKAADTALDTRLKKAEESLKDVSNVMDFRGAVDAKPATTEGYQKGDVIVVTKGDDAGKEFVCDDTGWVEFGNSNAEQAAIATLQEKDKTQDAAIATKAAQSDLNATNAAVAKKAEQTSLDATNKKVEQNIKDIATKAADADFKALKAVVDNKTTGLAATKAIADANKASIENASTGLAKAHEKADKNAQDITALTSGKENVGVAQGIVDKLNSNITGTPAVDSTITAISQTKGKVAATVSKIQIAETQVTGLSTKLSGLRTDVDTKQTEEQVKTLISEANIAQDHVTGLPGALQSLTQADSALSGRVDALETVKPAEAGAQVNKIETIKTGDGNLAISSKIVTIPTAMADKLGLVKSSAAENKISIAKDGVMEVNSLNVNKLVQTHDWDLVLDGGNATLIKQ